MKNIWSASCWKRDVQAKGEDVPFSCLVLNLVSIQDRNTKRKQCKARQVLHLLRSVASTCQSTTNKIQSSCFPCRVPTPKWSYLSSEKVSAMQIAFHTWVTEASVPANLSNYPTTALGWFVSCSPKSWHSQKWLESRQSCSVCLPMKETSLVTVHPNDIEGYRFCTFISLDCRISF